MSIDNLAMPWISVLVLTKNESLHIERCLISAKRLTNHVFVVDSGSSDDTTEIAKRMGVSVIVASYNNFAEKFNWSLENIDFPTPWIIRLDADEIFTDQLLAKIGYSITEMSAEVNGVYLRRQLWFMGQWIRHGGMYPTYSMRVWRRGKISCEIRGLDEHMILLSGIAASLDLDIIDNPIFSISTWVQKHNRYSTLEAASSLQFRSNENRSIKPSMFGSWAERRRWLKVNFYYKTPPFIRPLLYFFYRYVLQLGLLDGRVGFIFHFMHGLWYRCLVDAKILELKLAQEGEKIH